MSVLRQSLLAALVLSLAVTEVSAQGAWARLDRPIAMGEPTAAIDAGDRILVLTERLDEIRSLSLADPDAEWQVTPVYGAPPGGRNRNPVLRDGTRNRWILVRPDGLYPVAKTQLWVLDASVAQPAWTLLAESTQPAARIFPAAFFDEQENRVYLYGGRHIVFQPPDPYLYEYPEFIYTDLWSLDLDGPLAWQEVSLASPGPKLIPGAGAHFDATNGRLILIGQLASDGLTGSGKVWTLSLVGTPTWSLQMSGDLDWGFGKAFAFDDALGRFVQVGGRVRHGHGDYVSGWLYVGDLVAHTLRYPFVTGEWAPANWMKSGVYDPKRDRFLFVGGLGDPEGITASRELWSLEFRPDARWSRIGPGVGPPLHRDGEASVFDPVGDRVLVWAGARNHPCLQMYCNTSYFEELWSFESAGSVEWNKVPVSSSTYGGSYATSLVYDGDRRRLLAYGGTEYLRQVFPEVVELGLAIPSPLRRIVPPGPLPTSRLGHAAVLDSKRRRMVVMGGQTTGGTAFRDVWAFDAIGDGSWVQLPLDPANPAPGLGLRAAYDPVHDRVLAVAPPQGTETSPSLWELSLEPTVAWTKRVVTTTPGPSNAGPVAHDPIRGRLLLFEPWNPAGVSPSTIRTWALEEGLPTRWVLVEAVGQAQLPALGTSPVVYDGIRDRFVIAHPGNVAQVWALTFGAPEWPVELAWRWSGATRALSADEEIPFRILLRGASPRSSPIHPRALDLGRIDRSTIAWTGVVPLVDEAGAPRIEVADVDGDGVVDWTVDVALDPSAGPNAPVRFVAYDEGGAKIAGELTGRPRIPVGVRLHESDEPAGDEVVFSLRALAPRPGSARLRLVTPSRASVSAELFDVRGRRVANARLEPGDGSSLEFGWGSGVQLAPGVYLVRVRQGTNTATVRIVTL